ncbi:MAG: ribosome-associated heat shock protein Hsp15 [Parvicellaceae bacterium]|jgi:ribosome-associated heat shock protein Hsp15
MRLDKYLWSVRIFKTRSLATKECNSEHIKINNIVCKPSKTVQIGDEISVRIKPIWKTFKIIGIPKSRVGAILVLDAMLETTSKEELELLLSVQELNRVNRFHGIKGRPTKKQRRDLDKFR